MARRAVLGLVLLLLVGPAHAARLLGTITYDDGPTVNVNFRFSTKTGVCGGGCGHTFGGYFRCRGDACGGRKGLMSANIGGNGYFTLPHTAREACWFAQNVGYESPAIPFYPIDCTRQPIRQTFKCIPFEQDGPVRYASGVIELSHARCLRQNSSRS